MYASSYVGEAESIIRRAFTLARSVAPCILFFDELDAIIGSDNGSTHGGGNGMNRGSSAEARVMSTFLNEMDGVDASSDDGVLVLGATNRPHVLDAALLRPGRFDSVIYVPPPDLEARRSILKMECRRWQSFSKLNDETQLNIERLAKESALMTGAEIVGACREASMIALREFMYLQMLEKDSDEHTFMDQNCDHTKPLVLQRHLDNVFQNTKPLLSDKKILDEYKSFESEHALFQ